LTNRINTRDLNEIMIWICPSPVSYFPSRLTAPISGLCPSASHYTTRVNPTMSHHCMILCRCLSAWFVRWPWIHAGRVLSHGAIQSQHTTKHITRTLCDIVSIKNWPVSVYGAKKKQTALIRLFAR